MTRRARRARGRVRGLDAYLHRATLGLPRAQRLEAAAELRTHLLDRINALEGQGFSREEAEHLAVQAMGEPQVTNRQLLGHALTTPLGWGVLGLTLLIGGGVWADQAYRPTGLWPTAPHPMDDTAINRIWDSGWPRPWGSAFDSYTQAANLSFPEGTQTVFAAWMSHGDTEVRPVFHFAVSLGFGYGRLKPSTAPFVLGRPWHHRFRLVATAAPEFSHKSCPEGTVQSGTLLYSQDRLTVPRDVILNSHDGISLFSNLISGFCMKDLHNRVEMNPGVLTLNTWSKAYQVWGTVSGQQVSYALLLYPSDRPGLPTLRADAAFVFQPAARSWEPAQP
jgi:hypothetical protein